jgi:hypothetical protein
MVRLSRPYAARHRRLLRGWTTSQALQWFAQLERATPDAEQQKLASSRKCRRAGAGGCGQGGRSAARPPEFEDFMRLRTRRGRWSASPTTSVVRGLACRDRTSPAGIAPGVSGLPDLQSAAAEPDTGQTLLGRCWYREDLFSMRPGFNRTCTCTFTARGRSSIPRGARAPITSNGPSRCAAGFAVDAVGQRRPRDVQR